MQVYYKLYLLYISEISYYKHISEISYYKRPIDNSLLFPTKSALYVLNSD